MIIFQIHLTCKINLDNWINRYAILAKRTDT